MPIIQVDHVTKEYKLGQLTSLKQTLLNGVNRLTGRPVEERKPFKALDDISFSVEQGEVVGIIGHNGAGKSTILKLLANISKPTSGSVNVKGKIAPLIEVGAGFVADLTGRENVYLNGSIMGLPRKEIDRKLDEIVAFAEMEEFIDTPVKRYSSGMQVKLAFSVATSIEAEILIVDEVLAVGDLAFQRKCFDRMEDMIKRQGKTVILVSHNIRQVERLCSRAIILDHGRMLIDGDAKDVCGLFYSRNDEIIKHNAMKAAHADRHDSSGEVDLMDVFLVDNNGQPTDHIAYLEDTTVAVTFSVNTRLIRPIFGVGIHTTDFVYLTTEISNDLFREVVLTPGIHRVECKIPRFPFMPGAYSVRIAINAGEVIRSVLYAESVFHFQVDCPAGGRTEEMREGFISMHGEWSIAKTPLAGKDCHSQRTASNENCLDNIGHGESGMQTV